MRLNTLLFILFLIGQTLSAGNMNWQQMMGYREINPIYGKHPSPIRIYTTKVIETLIILIILSALYGFQELMLLVFVNLVCWGFIIYDRVKRIPFKMVWR